jgi:WD40 repeat protein
LENQENTTKVSALDRHVLVNTVLTLTPSHLDAVRAIAFHPTELCLATGGDDCTVKVWRTDVTGLASSKCAKFCC